LLCHPLATIHSPPSTRHHSLATTYSLPSTCHHPLATTYSLPPTHCHRDFLPSTDVGRLVPPLEEGDAGSEASEWERREREEEVEALGATDEMGAREELLLFLPTPLFMALAGED